MNPVGYNSRRNTNVGFIFDQIMNRTRAQWMLEYFRALNKRPLSLRELQAIAEKSFVDLRDAPSASESKLDCPLAVCCDDLRVVNACEESLGVLTIRDLSQVGRNQLVKVSNLAEKGIVALHGAVSEELGDHLLSCDLDDFELVETSRHNLVLRSDLRKKKRSWILLTFGDLGKRLVSLRGMYLDKLNNETPTREPQDDDF